MPQESTVFHCASCDAQFPKWSGRCLECGQWGTLKEMIGAPTTGGAIFSGRTSAGSAQATALNVAPMETQKLSTFTSAPAPRLTTGISEADRVLGGGIVPGSLILLGGEPGIGKSTLVAQIAAGVSRLNSSATKTESAPALYISGEESGEQIGLRASRLGIPDEAFVFLSCTETDQICATIQHVKPSLAIVDSMQTIAAASVEGEAGNITQIKASAAKLMETAKRTRIPIILIGHVTKDGLVAGPRMLEHLVDVVLYLEGERYQDLRILRAVKNRFGGTDEIGVFSMTRVGLTEVINPSAAFLAERGSNVPGAIITCVMEGTRPLLVEIQALVAKTHFGYPERRASGFDVNRLKVLLAVLSRRLKLPLDTHDVFLNVVGGLDAREPAADLAVAMAMASALYGTVIPPTLFACGEVGLGGEVRSVPFLEKRIGEADKLGFEYAVVPKYKSSGITHERIKISPIADVSEIVNRLGVTSKGAASHF